MQLELAIRNTIFRYYESFPYCESSSFIKLNFGKHQHSVMAIFYTVAESLIASSDCITKLHIKLQYIGNHYFTSALKCAHSVPP